MKYELTDNTIEYRGHILHQIRALKDIDRLVKKGSLGGYIESENNLSQEGNCWICGKAKVFANAKVIDNCKICGESEIYGDSVLTGDCQVYNTQIYGNATLHGFIDIENSIICDNVLIKSNNNNVDISHCQIKDNTFIKNNCILKGCIISGNSSLCKCRVIKSVISTSDLYSVYVWCSNIEFGHIGKDSIATKCISIVDSTISNVAFDECLDLYLADIKSNQDYFFINGLSADNKSVDGLTFYKGQGNCIYVMQNSNKIRGIYHCKIEQFEESVYRFTEDRKRKQFYLEIVKIVRKYFEDNKVLDKTE